MFLAVLLAALPHATWNALVKGGAGKHTSMAAVVIGQLPIALVVLPLVPLPAAGGLPWLLVVVVIDLLP